MPKHLKYISGLILVLVVAGTNLSSMCHPSESAAPKGELIDHRAASLMSIEESFSVTADNYVSESAEDVVAPKELTWSMLSDVEFKDVYLEELDAYYWKPFFGETVLGYEGQDFYITGYIIPVDYDEDFYVLSRYPFANCFFCGGAGPETVVDLRFPGKTRTYKTDERLTFKGTLKLNADDVYQINYILNNAVEYTP